MQEPAAPKGHIHLDQIIPARQPWSGIVSGGQVLRIIDLEGSQAVDFLCYNNQDRQERYHAPNTLKSAGTLRLTTGHSLYSDLAQPLFTIIDDTFGGHDTVGGCCSAASNHMLYGVENIPGCRENFLAGLAEHGMGRVDVVPNVNFFMEFPITSEGAITPGRSRPGDHVDLRANLETLVVISNCPQVNNPCNNYNPTPIRIIIFDPEQDS